MLKKAFTRNNNSNSSSNNNNKSNNLNELLLFSWQGAFELHLEIEILYYLLHYQKNWLVWLFLSTVKVHFNV
jgi:hypothetical protein